MESELSWWAVYESDTGKPVFKSSDQRYLTKLLNELKISLGDKFFLEEYKERNESTS